MRESAVCFIRRACYSVVSQILLACAIAGNGLFEPQPDDSVILLQQGVALELPFDGEPTLLPSVDDNALAIDVTAGTIEETGVPQVGKPAVLDAMGIERPLVRSPSSAADSYDPNINATTVNAATAAPSFQCASTPDTWGNCPECTVSETCACTGYVRFGYSPFWSEWVVASGSIECTSATFGDPYPSHGKVCVCSPSATAVSPQAAAAATAAGAAEWCTGISLKWPTAVVTATFLAVYGIFTAARIGAHLLNKPPGTVELTMQSVMPTVYIAPMLLTIFVAVSKRAWKVTNGCPSFYNMPSNSVRAAIVICALAFAAQTALCTICMWLVLRREQTKPWTQFLHIAVTIMYLSLIVILAGLVNMHEPGTLRAVIGRTGLATGTMCTIVLSILYFSVYLMLHLLNFVWYSPFGVAVARLAATTMHFAPMLCILFLGTQVAVDDAGVPLPEYAERWMLTCTFSVLLQLVLAVIAPFIFRAQLQPSQKCGEDTLVMTNHEGFVLTSMIRWAAMTLLYAGVFWVCVTLWQLRVWPVVTNVLVLVSSWYFAVYLILWLLMTARQLQQGGFSKLLSILTVARDVVAICPMIGGVVLVLWWRHLMEEVTSGVQAATETRGCIIGGEFDCLISGQFGDGMMPAALLALLLQVFAVWICRGVQTDPGTQSPQVPYSGRINESVRL